MKQTYKQTKDQGTRQTKGTKTVATREKGKPGKGGQINGDEWKLDFVGWVHRGVSRSHVINLHTWNLYVSNQSYPNKFLKQIMCVSSCSKLVMHLWLKCNLIYV